VVLRSVWLSRPASSGSKIIANLSLCELRTLVMKSSTKDRIKGRFSETKGKLKEKAGRATRDPEMQDRGTAERVGGKVQRKVGEVKKVFGT
jgi:uncharacterized protein YjbJ (UPF0337 family)